MLKKLVFSVWIFPVLVLTVYIILFIITPDNALIALKRSGKTFINIIFPLCFVFIFMTVLNLFIKPKHIVKLIGKGTTMRGVLLTTVAGIISMGPIFIWYGFLKELRENGVENSLLAIFLGNRAIKPFLLPVMIAYFGWIYTLILTVFTILGALVVGYSVGAVVKEDTDL
jgi:uncharacterized membrane protein YraQ (UPF0718 family)